MKVFLNMSNDKAIGTDMLTDFINDFLARRALSRREQKQNKFLLF